MTETTDQGQIDSVAMVMEAVKTCRQGMSSRIEAWIEAKEAYITRSPVLTQRSISVEVNHLRPLVERQLPRDAQALHPQRPYLPLRANLPSEQWRARIYERGIDNSMDRSGYFPEFVSAKRSQLVYGSGFVMGYWDSWFETSQIRRPSVDPTTGEMTGMSEELSRWMNDGLRYRFIQPWCVMVPPSGQTLLDKEYVIINRIVTVAEMERCLEAGKYTLPKGRTTKDLRAGVASDAVEWQRQFEKDLDIAYQGSDAQAAGILTEFYSDKRWTAVWNSSLDLMEGQDQSPRLYNVDHRMKPLAQLRMNPGVGSSLFWGEGWHENIRDKAMLDSLFVTMHAHRLMIDSAKWTWIKKGLLDPERVSGLDYGEMVELDESVQDGRQAVGVIDYGEPGSGMMEFHGFLDDQITRMSNQTEIPRGINPPGVKTARGLATLQGESQMNLGFGARYEESTYLIELAAITTSLFGSNVTMKQFAEMVGWEDAMKATTPDPHSIPGGFHFQFDGAERVSGRQAKFERKEHTWSLVSQIPQIAGSPDAIGVFVDDFMEAADFDDKQRERVMGVFAPQPPVAPVQPPGAAEPGLNDMAGAPGAPIERAPSMMPQGEQMASPAGNEQAMMDQGAG